MLILMRGAAVADQKTDVVTLANGDRITGEIDSLDRGQLVFKTDDEGTIKIEWDKITSVRAVREFEVGTSDGRRFLGSLAGGASRIVVVMTAAGPISLRSDEVTLIMPIGANFFKKLHGSIDVGFSYTHSSEIAQLNVNASTSYRRPRSEVELTGSGTLTKSGQDETSDDRAVMQASYRRYRGDGWFVAAAGGVESNESLGIKLRSQIGVSAGPRLVNTNRAQLSLGGGLVANDERGVDSEPTQNLEGILLAKASFYTYDRPRTNVDVTFQYYPSLSNIGRHRLQFDAAFKRELWKDLFLTVNGFDTFDSRPPNPHADRNDVGVVLSIGWSY